jgi:hypothetical protein
MSEYIVVMEGKVNTKKFTEKKANELAVKLKKIFPNIKIEVKKGNE